MMDYRRGDLFDADVEVIVNTVNTVGVGGAGIALQFKIRYPDNFAAYAKACKDGKVRTGKMFVSQLGDSCGPKWIINFPTKEHWRNDSKIEYIETGLDALVEEITKLGIRSIAIPALGCSNGRLQWSIVKELIEKKLGPLMDVTILVFEPR